MKTEYYCAKCGKELKENEKPCSKCGSKLRNIKVEIQENISLKDEISLVKNNVLYLLNSFEELSKSMHRAYILFFIVTIFCVLPNLFYLNTFNFERIIIASTGVLTFVAIFYSLIFSKEGKKTLDSVNELTKDKIKELTEFIKKKIDKSEDLKEIENELKNLSNEILEIDWVKKMSDIEYILIVAVVTLIISIILSLNNNFGFDILSYTFFILGTSFTIYLLIIWRLISKFSINWNKHKQI